MGIMILGTGGHAKVALDILLEMKETVEGFLDDNPEMHGKKIHSYPVIGPIGDWKLYGRRMVMGIGDCKIKKAIYDKLGEGPYWYNLRHPSAVVSKFAHIEPGAMICMGACIGSDAHIGKMAVINTGATVDHDCVVGDFAHVAPGAHLSGNVKLGEGAFFGAGAVSRQGITVGEWSTVGAGAVLVKDVPPNVTVVGVPAKLFEF